MRSSAFLSILSSIGPTLAQSAIIPTLFPASLSNLVPRDWPSNRALCPLNKAILPTSTLPGPSTGLFLSFVAIGRGTQNYTCADATAASVPSSNGAVAALFDASCFAPYADKLAQFTAWTTSVDPAHIPAIMSSGHHFFSDKTTPVFDLSKSLGRTSLSKTASVIAPANERNDIPWLKLTTVAGAGTTSKVQEIYRVNTAKGSAPSTCDGQRAEFMVQYAAEYWFYSKQ